MTELRVDISPALYLKSNKVVTFAGTSVNSCVVAPVLSPGHRLSRTTNTKIESISLSHHSSSVRVCRNYSWHNIALVAAGKNQRNLDFDWNLAFGSLIAQMLHLVDLVGPDLVLLYHLGLAMILIAALGLYSTRCCSKLR